ncbi:unnamed protein product [Chironomus riparius]|uniref:non-specific serine/threonine protein kinase n=1 Tax=Chironomus riparius TaxID=315576 RepID=A0A9N9RK50_9DIPT|nr:unnamed protein product [Chironomus riparius]
MGTILHEIPEDPNEDEKSAKSIDATPYEKVLSIVHDPKYMHEIGLSRIGLYKFCGDIGKGNFSRVKKAVHLLTKDKVAIKIVDRSRLDSKNLRMLSREVSTLECVQHPYILRLFEVVETLGRVHLITEYIPGGELYYKIVQNGIYSEDKASIMFKQVSLAVQHMHHLGYVHRDIKAENILVQSDEHYKLCDFGFSTQITSSQDYLNTFCGSPPYAAPELFKDEQYLASPVDIWSLGILLFFILTGSMPFSAPSIPQLRTTILKGEYQLPGILSPSCVKLIQNTLLHNPLHRPSIDQILRCEWLQNRSKKSLVKSQTSLDEAQTIIQKRKRPSFWCSKSRRTSPISPNKIEKQPPEPIDCYTKKFDNVPVEKFRNPIENESSSMSSAKTVIPINNHLSTFKRNNSLINSSKIVNKSHNNNNVIAQNNDIIQVRSYSNDHLEDSSIESEKDFERFMMIPSRTNCDEDLLRALNPLEKEVRKLMNSHGISNELLEKHIDNGPRSEIIGIYRILLMRLKTQKEQASIVNGNQGPDRRSYKTSNASRSSNSSRNHKSLRKKRNNFCAIL